jgi:hypothetical protein
MAAKGLLLRVNTVEPPVAHAGQCDQWTVRLSGLEVAAGRRVRLVLGGEQENPSDWGMPQVEDEGREGFVSAEASNGAAVALRVPPWEEAREVAVELTLGAPGLSADDTLAVVLGDQSHHGPGLRAQTFSQRHKPLRVLVEVQEGQWEEVANPPQVEVVGGMADRVRIFLPATVRPEEAFDGLVKVEDPYGNLASFYHGSLELEAEGAQLNGTTQLNISAADGCLKPLQRLRVRPEGPCFRIRGREASHGTETLSNPVRVLGEEERYHLYWGVLHGHTALSDGVGTPEEYFERLRDENRLDFGALAEPGGGEGYEEAWQRVQRATATYYQPGRFVTFLGYEWASDNGRGDGVRGIYYPDDWQPQYGSDPGHFPRPWHLLAVLHERHRGRALVIPRHTASRARFCDFRHHDPFHERLIEIYSAWGSSECSVHDGNPYPLRPPGLPEGGEAQGVPLDAGEEPAGFVQRALALGWRVGFTAGGGDRYCHPGDGTRSGPEPFRYRDGLLGVWAEELTREALWEGLWQRRTLATTGARLIVLWWLDEHFMGSQVVVGPRHRALRQRTVRVEAYGEQRIVQVDILRNNQVVHSVRPGKQDVQLRWCDREPFAALALQPAPSRPPFIFYYVRVLQADGEMAWASPIWLTLAQ